MFQEISSHAFFSRDSWRAHFKSAAEKPNEITWLGKTPQELATLNYMEGRGGWGVVQVRAESTRYEMGEQQQQQNKS